MMEEEGHGTFVAGEIAAAIDNSRGIAGLAPSARLLVLMSSSYGAACSVASPVPSTANLAESDLVNMARRDSGSSLDCLDRDCKDSVPVLKVVSHMLFPDSDQVDFARRDYCSGWEDTGSFLASP